MQVFVISCMELTCEVHHTHILYIYDIIHTCHIIYMIYISVNIHYGATWSLWVWRQTAGFRFRWGPRPIPEFHSLLGVGWASLEVGLLQPKIYLRPREPNMA